MAGKGPEVVPERHLVVNRGAQRQIKPHHLSQLLGHRPGGVHHRPGGDAPARLQHCALNAAICDLYAHHLIDYYLRSLASGFPQQERSQLLGAEPSGASHMHPSQHLGTQVGKPCRERIGGLVYVETRLVLRVAGRGIEPNRARAMSRAFLRGIGQRRQLPACARKEQIPLPGHVEEVVGPVSEVLQDVNGTVGEFHHRPGGEEIAIALRRFVGGEGKGRAGIDYHHLFHALSHRQFIAGGHACDPGAHHHRPCPGRHISSLRPGRPRPQVKPNGAGRVG